MKSGKIVVPHEHGGWAMVSAPFLLGVLAGKPSALHIPMFLGWLCLYLASYPMLQTFKRGADRRKLAAWGIGYGTAGALFLIAPIAAEPRLLYFGIPILALLPVNLWHAKRKTERAFVNDLCAVLLFAAAGAAAYLAGGGGWDRMMALVAALSFLHFAGSIFFVKTVFRERTSKRWLRASRAYHVLLLLLPWTAGVPQHALPFLFSAVRAFACAGRKIRPMTVGLIEIAGTVQFTLLSALLLP